MKCFSVSSKVRQMGFWHGIQTDWREIVLMVEKLSTCSIRKKLAELKFPTFWCDPTPQGKFMLSIAFSQSKYYVDNLSENIKRGKRNKVKDGIWPQMSPLGYLNVGGRIIVDKNIAPLIKKTFEAYSSGSFTLRESFATNLTNLD